MCLEGYVPLRPQATKARAEKRISIIIEMQIWDYESLNSTRSYVAQSLNHPRNNIYPLTTHDYSGLDIYYRDPKKQKEAVRIRRIF